jgi:hypothetical protein
MKEILRLQDSRPFLTKFIPDSLIGVFYSLLPDSSGAWIRDDYNADGDAQTSVKVALCGAPCTIPSRNSNSIFAAAKLITLQRLGNDKQLCIHYILQFKVTESNVLIFSTTDLPKFDFNSMLSRCYSETTGKNILTKNKMSANFDQ